MARREIGERGGKIGERPKAKGERGRWHGLDARAGVHRQDAGATGGRCQGGAGGAAVLAVKEPGAGGDGGGSRGR